MVVTGDTIGKGGLTMRTGIDGSNKTNSTVMTGDTISNGSLTMMTGINGSNKTNPTMLTGHTMSNGMLTVGTGRISCEGLQQQKPHSGC